MVNAQTVPGTLIIPAGTAPHMRRILRDQHTERLRIFREVAGVEHCLKQQIVPALEPQCIQALRDATTG